jgi:hypothetical protein
LALEFLALSRKQVGLVAAVLAIKTVLTVFVFQVFSNDFVNWTNLARNVLLTLQTGSIPSIAELGAYTGQAMFLAPFLAAWYALPFPHPSIAQALSKSFFSEHYSLIFLMKLPLIVFDLLAGLVVSLIAKASNEGTLAAKAFFVWYLNPIPFYLMEYLGTFDIVSTVFVLLAVLMAMRKKLIRAGSCLSIATLLRIYPVLILPFLALQSLKKASTRATVEFLASYFAPIAAVLFAQALITGSLEGMIVTLAQVLTKQPWLLDFAGMPILPFLALMPFLLAVQFHLSRRYWAAENLSPMNLALCSLLIILLSTYHQPYHLAWLLPLLTAYYVVNRDSTGLFVFFFLSAYLYSLGHYSAFSLGSYQPLFAGLFVGANAVYLLRINLHGMRPRTLRTLPEQGKALSGESWSVPSAVGRGSHDQR